MLEHLGTRYNVAFDKDPNVVCKHLAKYKQGTSVLCVVGNINKPANSDILSFRDFGRGMTVGFHKGFMLDLTEINGEQTTASNLFLRHDPECLGDIRKIRHEWGDEYYDIFATDEYLQANRHRFEELFAEDVELPHGPTYHLLGLKLEELSVQLFQRTLPVEENPKFQKDIIVRLKQYAVRDYRRGNHDLIERIFAVRLLEALGEKDAAEEAKRFVFKKHKLAGRWGYSKSESLSVPEQKPYRKKFVPQDRFRDF
ncbi:MAG: hypothetical protein KAT43_06425 [Nanoarchaeota archaeon]|nr:hypothetical protein [Nanoarchaeota archaeon]